MYLQEAAGRAMEQRVATWVRRGQLGVIRDALEHGGTEDVGSASDLEEQSVAWPKQVGCGDQGDVELDRLTRHERDRHGAIAPPLIVPFPCRLHPAANALEPAPP